MANEGLRIGPIGCIGKSRISVLRPKSQSHQPIAGGKKRIAVITRRRGHNRPDPLAQLQHHPLGNALPNTVGSLNGGRVASRDRPPHHVGRIHTAQSKCHARTNPAHSQERLEESALVVVNEAVEIERVVADGEVRRQLDWLTDWRKRQGGCGGDAHEEPDATDLDDGGVLILRGEASSDGANHRARLLRTADSAPKRSTVQMAHGHRHGVGGMVGRGLGSREPVNHGPNLVF